MTLAELAKKHGTDKHEHGYCAHYQHHIPKLEGKLLEIGIQDGASLRTWQDFYPEAEVIGIDNNPVCMIDGLDCVLGDVTKPEDVDRFNDLDVVIDDGSHNSHEICAAFQLLWPKLNPGGWYVIEDLATQFNEAWGGSEAGSSATNFLHKQLDKTWLNQNVSELHAYEEIVFMRKK